MKNCIRGPKTGPQGENEIFGVNFEDLLFNIFEKNPAEMARHGQFSLSELRC